VAQSGQEGECAPFPCGTLSMRCWPRGAQPRRRVMLVLAQVSSMTTRRPGSSRL
jgi:hypothetical protein